MARRHELSREETNEVTYGLKMRLRYHILHKQDLETALICYKAYHRFAHHQKNRPTYPDWCKNPDLENPENNRRIWGKLELESKLSQNQTWCEIN